MDTHENPAIVLGAMNFGSTVPEAASHQILDRFAERGGRWIDTADCYSFWNEPNGVGGASEEVIGHWLASRPGVRDQVAISTKVRHRPLVPHQWPSSAEGLSEQAVLRGLDGSLGRLGVDHVDLLWAHAEDRSVDLAETAEVFGRLAAEGTARRIGASNHAIWRVERARALAHARGLPAWSALQQRYTYLQPRPGQLPTDGGHQAMTDETLDYAATEPGMMVWAYTPLIEGAYTRPDRPIPEYYDHPGTTRRLAVLAAVSRDLGATPNQVVLAWLMRHGPGVSPIVGVSTTGQLDEALDAQDVVLTDEYLRRLEEPG